MRVIRTILGIFLFLWIAVRPLQAANAVVGTGTAVSCTEAAFNIALATVQGSGSGTITFNCGGAATILFTGGKVISNSAVTIDGGSNITLSGGNAVRHFYVESNATLMVKNLILTSGFDNTFGGGSILNLGGATLENSTIRDSNVASAYSGGAIFSYGPVTIGDSLIENNTGGSAGGLYMAGATAVTTISNSTFRNNRTTNSAFGLGGAITVWTDAEATIEGSTLEQNQAIHGGGIFNNGQIELTNSTLTGNSANRDGGGLHNYLLSIAALSNVTFSDNSALYGGAISASLIVGQSDWVNLTIENNQAERGGGIYLIDSTLVISHATIRNNSAALGAACFRKTGI